MHIEQITSAKNIVKESKEYLRLKAVEKLQSKFNCVCVYLEINKGN